MWTAIKSVLGGQKDRRVAPRVSAVGKVMVDSQEYQLENWSTSGILVSGHDGHLAKGQKFKLTVHVQDDNRLIIFNAVAVVVRTAGDKFAAQFHKIDSHKKQMIMEYFARKAHQQKQEQALRR
jgi:hypothetical protein